MELTFVWIVLAALLAVVDYLAWDRMRLQRRVAELEPIVFVDELTRIGNRRRFNEAMVAGIAHALRAGESVVLVLIDVNDFKVPNDRYGHPFGDRMLQAIAACVAGQVRPTDAACRIGGDEFAVILVDCDVRGAFGVVERIVRRLERSALEINDETVPLRVSFGGTGMEIVAGHVYVGGFDLGKTNDAGIHARVMENLYAQSDARLGEAKLRKPLEEYPSQID